MQATRSSLTGRGFAHFFRRRSTRTALIDTRWCPSANRPSWEDRMRVCVCVCVRERERRDLRPWVRRPSALADTARSARPLADIEVQSGPITARSTWGFVLACGSTLAHSVARPPIRRKDFFVSGSHARVSCSFLITRKHILNQTRPQLHKTSRFLSESLGYGWVNFFNRAKTLAIEKKLKS